MKIFLFLAVLLTIQYCSTNLTELIKRGLAFHLLSSVVLVIEAFLSTVLYLSVTQVKRSQSVLRNAKILHYTSKGEYGILLVKFF